MITPSALLAVLAIIFAGFEQFEARGRSLACWSIIFLGIAIILAKV